MHLKGYLIWYILITGLGTIQAQSFDWISDEYPGSFVIDIAEIEDSIYVIVGNGEVFEYNPSLEYQFSLYKLETDQESEYNLLVNKVHSSIFQDSFASYSAHYIGETDTWLIIQAKQLQGYLYRYKVLLYDRYFSLLDETSIDTLGLPMACFFDSYGSETKVLGTILGPPEVQLFYLNYDHTNPNHLPGIQVKQSIPKPMFFITSMNIDDTTGHMITFYYNGIAILDTNLYQVKRFDHLTDIGTSDHGSVLRVGNYFYSHGARRFEWNVGDRHLVFHQYDTNFIKIRADTFGIDGQDNYPFFKRSLDHRNGTLVVGGHLDGPFNQPDIFASKKKFYLAKYDLDLNQIWYKEYGGDRAYWIAGLFITKDQGCILYGFVTDSFDGYRYAYVMHVDANGDIISSTTMPPNDARGIRIINPGNDYLRLINPNQVNAVITLFDLNGRVILNREIMEDQEEISTSHLPIGMYPYTIREKNQIIATGKWIKTH